MHRIVPFRLEQILWRRKYSSKSLTFITVNYLFKIVIYIWKSFKLWTTFDGIIIIVMTLHKLYVEFVSYFSSIVSIVHSFLPQ